MIPFDPTLAQGTGQGFSLWNVVVYGIIGVIFVSTMIKNVINESKKKSRRNAPGNAPGNTAQSSGGASLDDIAARRRAQLQEMARQRSAGGNDSSNLSMAERIARARATQQGKPQARSGNPLPSENAPPRRAPQANPAPTGASARQQRAEALRQKMMQRQQQQREALAARQRQVQQAKAQRSAQPARPQPTARPTPQAAAPRRPLPPVQTPHPISAEPHKEVHRMVEDVSEFEVGSKRRRRELAARRANPQLIDFSRLSKADLRRAFILKEVLDRPVSERDPLADFNAG